MHSKTSILIIDDEKDFCELITNILHKEPYSIECAYTILEARKSLTLRSPDFILLDNNLPDGKGIDFLQEYNALFEGSKIIMMTADSSDHLRQRAYQWGVYEFLLKPFSFIKLRELISAVPDIV
jgi:two-component system, OmpR family, KDP operon response regulator KdpE